MTARTVQTSRWLWCERYRLGSEWDETKNTPPDHGFINILEWVTGAH